MINCVMCDKHDLEKDTIGINKKLLGTDITNFYCMDCLANYLDCTVEELLDKIEEFKEEALRKIVYTSFDGDDMHHMLAICEQVLNNQMIALNSEMALGYYISTETLGGQKINVMTDCLTLTIFSDKLSRLSKSGAKEFISSFP